MSLCLVRIDDRLIHGQVVIGWGNYLHFNHIILCSDEVATTDWEREIYLDAVPEDITAEIITIEEAAQKLKHDTSKDLKTILLVESPKVIVDLLDMGAKINTVNVGGMHYKEGKICIASFIYVDKTDVSYFKELNRRCVTLQGQDVPTAKKIDIVKLLRFNKN